MHGRRVADNANLYEAVLTTKGLAILNSVPDSLKEKTPIGQRISVALKSGTREAVNTVISQLISASVKGMLPGP
jgi:hypothetical protein